MTPEKPPPPAEPRWAFEIYEAWPAADVPGPERSRTKYPWEHMDVCDQGLVHCAPEDREKVQVRVSASGGKWFRRHRPELTVVTRQVPQGVRCVVWEASP